MDKIPNEIIEIIIGYIPIKDMAKLALTGNKHIYDILNTRFNFKSRSQVLNIEYLERIQCLYLIFRYHILLFVNQKIGSVGKIIFSKKIQGNFIRFTQTTPLFNNIYLYYKDKPLNKKRADLFYYKYIISDFICIECTKVLYDIVPFSKTTINKFNNIYYNYIFKRNNPKQLLKTYCELDEEIEFINGVCDFCGEKINYLEDERNFLENKN